MVVNLISTDAQILLETLPYFLQGALAPAQIIITLGLLSRFLKAFCLISLAVAILASPISGILAGKLGFQMAMVQKKGDIRLKLVKEFLTAVRIVKYYAWEKPFLANISKSRLDQLKQVKGFLISRAWLISVLTNIPGLGIGFTFFFYGLKNSLNFEAVFASLVYLNMLAIPFIYLPMLVAFGAQYYTSLKRIEFFALRSELKVREIENEDPEDSTPIVPRSSGNDDTSSSSSSSGPSDRHVSTKTKSSKRPRGGMYIRGAAFAWETLLSIAESRFIDLENKESGDQAAVGAAGDAATKKTASDELKHTQAEKAHIAVIIKSIQRQIASGVSPDDVNIDEEEKDCIDATEAENAENNTNVEVAVTDEGVDTADPEEIDEATTEKSKKSKKSKDGAKSDEKKRKFTKLRRPVVNLRELDFDVRKGSLTMVVGSVGSGKTTLAMAFLGEVHQLGGEVKVFESFAYSSQEAWILNATIRDNITFGSPFNPERYANVIRCCALTTDLASFPASDLTEIGERGINLSGGQKQRINVARAMYSDNPIVILDDPFSAVDSHVGEHMFEHVAMGLRNSGRTVLLITNQLHFVPNADYVGVIKNGRMVEQGTFADLSAKSNGRLAKMLAKQSKREDPEDSIIGSEAENGRQTGSGEDPAPSGSGLAQSSSSSIKKSSTSIMKSATSLGRSGELKASTAIAKGDDDLDVAAERERLRKEKDIPFELTPEKDEEMKRKGALILVEERETGNIGLSTYWNYIKSGSLWIMALYVLMMMANAALQVFSGIWLSWWADPTKATKFSKSTYLGGYMGIVLGQGATICIGSIIFVYFCVNTGKNLHGGMLSAVSTAPTGWFDRTPLGRIIARFSKDMALVDMELPSMFDQFIHFFFALLGLFASIATGTAYILIIIAVAFIAFGALTLHYRKTSIQVQRIESLSRAPIFSHFAETLDGAVTIRAYKMDRVFRVANMNKIDVNNVDFLGLKYCSTWFAMTLDMLGAITVALSYIAMILVRKYATSGINVGFIIYAISQTGGVTQTLAAVSHMVTDLENKMNSVERILQYSRLESEGPFEVEANKPPPDWPSQGGIVLDNLSVEYKPGLPVLKNLTCNFKPREKVGIVGRTGAGKSTLITALFRTMEPVTGRILIDDIDITQIGLTDLRSKLSIIPQTPQLFVGTVRYNLDPFEEHQDDELWRVLKMVKLKKHVAELDGALYAPVDEGGSNFSVGQRQLLAMARCLLRQTHVLLLDEATAAVDVETDALLQQMIRKNFRDKTVLTIAHRLNTIMDSDRILVLDSGHIAEFDTPKNLLKNKKSVLSGMVEATGPITAAYLREIANRKAALDEYEHEEGNSKAKKPKGSN
jgi:ABC-type multidrug transport system fused ATPase/permease subunit